MVRFSCLCVSWIVTLLAISTSLDFITGVPITSEPLQKYDNGGLLPNSNQADENNLSREGGNAGEVGINGDLAEDKIPEQSNLVQNNLPQLANKPLEPDNQKISSAENNHQPADPPQLVNNPTENQGAGNEEVVGENSLSKLGEENKQPGHNGGPSETVLQPLDKRLPGSNNEQPQNKLGDTNTLGSDGQPLQSKLLQMTDNGPVQPLQNNPSQQGNQEVPSGQPQQNNLAQMQNANELGNKLQPLNPPQLGNKDPIGQPLVQNNPPLGNTYIPPGQPLQNYQQVGGLGSDRQPLQNNQQNLLSLNSQNKLSSQTPKEAPQVPLSLNPVEGKAEDPSRSRQGKFGSLGQEISDNKDSVENTLWKLGLGGINDKEQEVVNGPIGMINQQEGQDQRSDSRQGQEVEDKIKGDQNYAIDGNLQKIPQINKQAYGSTESSPVSVISSSPSTKPGDVMDAWRKNYEAQKEFWEDDNVEDDSDEDDEDTDDDEDKDVVSDKQYTEDGYLDAPADNVDNVGRLVDKTDEETNRNNNNYDESSDGNQINQNIMDDNNEQAVYNNNLHQLGGEKDPDEDYQLNKDEDEDTYQEKIDRIDFDQSTPAPDDDHWYDDRDDEDESDILGGDDDNEAGDFVDKEALFNRNHPKRPFTPEEDNPIYFNNMYPKLKEGLVEYKMIQNRSSINAPSSMVLFYTWIILIVLIAVVTFSAFRYRCKGMLINGSRNFRNGNHGNFKNGEENKKLLENVYA